MGLPNSEPAGLYGDGYSVQVVHDMLAGVSPAPGIDYTKITLTNPNIAGLTDRHNPAVKVVPSRLSLCWPGGQPNTGTTFETLMYGGNGLSEADAMALAVEMRELILGASIGSAALGRVPKDVRTASRQFSEDTGHKPEDALAAWCRRLTHT